MDEKDARLAAVTLRVGYGQALEAFLSMIFSTLQAPDCIPGWLSKYQIKDLRALVRAITAGEKIRSKIRLESFSWRGVSAAMHYYFSLEDKNREIRIKEGFGDLWSRFAKDFLDEDQAREYNSIKHGLRIHAGGFTLRMGQHNGSGPSSCPTLMHNLGGSEFGSNFFVPEDFAEASGHFRIRRVSRNWTPQNFAARLVLISASLRNVISFLRSLNGIRPDQVKYSFPKDPTNLGESWKNSTGVLSIGLDRVVPSDAIENFSSQEILRVYDDEKRTAGV